MNAVTAEVDDTTADELKKLRHRFKELESRARSGAIGTGWACDQFQGIMEGKGMENITVDRSRRSGYPSFIVRPRHLDLEDSGLSNYNINNIQEIWPGTGERNLEAVYTQLLRNGLITSCLAFQDAEEIRKRGVQFFKRHFAGKFLVFWQSLSLRKGRGDHVPILALRDETLVIEWSWLIRMYGPNYSTPIFKLSR